MFVLTSDLMWAGIVSSALFSTVGGVLLYTIWTVCGFLRRPCWLAFHDGGYVSGHWSDELHVCDRCGEEYHIFQSYDI